MLAGESRAQAPVWDTETGEPLPLVMATRLLAQAPAPGARAAEKDGPDDGLPGMFRGIQPTLGPVLWRASLTSEYRVQKAADGSRQRGFSEFGKLSASSHVYEPWFAQVNGTLGFVRSNTTGLEKSRATTLIGGAGLSLFPVSRFPFSASFSINDSRASGEHVGTDYRTTLIGLRQSYRTANDVQLSLTLDRSELSGTAVGKDVLNVIGASVSGRRAEHSYSAEGSLSANSGGVNGTQSHNERLAARHSYIPASNLNVETLATYNRQELEQGNAPVRSALATRFVQLASFGTWRPEEDEPFYDEKHPMLLTGGVRLTAFGIEQAQVATQNLNASANAGLSYGLSQLTRLTANASVAQASSSPGGNTFTTAYGATVTHAPLPVRWNEFSYTSNLSGGGSGSVSSGAGAQSSQTLFSQANHQLSRAFAFNERAHLTLSIGQGAGISFTTTGGNGFGLNHHAQATWSLPGETSSLTYLSLSGSDARTFSPSRSEFQLVNFQATRQTPLTALSFWSANLTVQGSRQRSDSPAGGFTAAQDPGFLFTTFGSVSYQHRRAFGVPRLRFIGSYTANQAQLQSRALGDLNAPRHTIGDALDARLEYQIGKVDARLVFRSAAVDGKRNTGLFLRVARYF
jgi:hypothetical protein